jgi:TFIIH basal transcription factor complex helicase XPB subunit
LQRLLKDPEIQNCRLRRDVDDDKLISELVKKSDKDCPIKSSANTSAPLDSETNGANVPNDINNYIEKMENDDDDENYNEKIQLVSFEVKQDEIENLQKRCIQLEYPLLAEYDFKNDTHNPNIK